MCAQKTCTSVLMALFARVRNWRQAKAQQCCDDKQGVVCPCNRLLLSNRKKQPAETLSNMDECQIN